MSDLKPSMNQNQPQSAAGAQPASGADALAHLHKMSTTAGLGSQEYVAINGMAIATIVAGLASGLALLSPVFLVIPVVAVICAIIALRQIRHSNGTQGGVGLTVLGLLLGLGLGGAQVTQHILQTMKVAPEQRQIVGVIERLDALVRAEKWDDAYALFSERFRNEKVKISKDAFAQRWIELQAPLRGKMKSLKWNGVDLEFQVDGESGAPIATAMILLDMEKASGSWRQAMGFRKVGDQWVIDAMPELFPPPAAPGGPGGPGGPGRGAPRGPGSSAGPMP